MPRSGSGFESDSVAEGLELSDVVALLGLGVDVSREVVGAEVVEAGLGIRQQVPDDDQHRAPDRDDRLLLPAASCDPAVPLAEEGVGAARDGRGLTEDPCEVPVAVAGGPVALVLAGRGLDARGELRPRAQVPSGGEPGHVEADLGDDDRCRDRSNPGDLIEPLHRKLERGQVGLDLGVEDRDVGVDPADAGQHPGQQEPVMVVESDR